VFISDFGSNLPESRQADVLYFMAHGYPDLTLDSSALVTGAGTIRLDGSNRLVLLGNATIGVGLNLPENGPALFRIAPEAGSPPGHISVRWTGPPESEYRIETSSDLVRWTTVPASITEVSHGVYTGTIDQPASPNSSSAFASCSFPDTGDHAQSAPPRTEDHFAVAVAGSENSLSP